MLIYEIIPRAFHSEAGSRTKATPDGRLDYEPFAPGLSAWMGSDVKGPTALLNSAAKINTDRFVGGVITNIRFHPNILKDTSSRGKAKDLINAFFKKGGLHLQMNCVNTETLLNAKKEPEKYRDLMVRVGGYVDYFTNMDPISQDEIISRTIKNI